MVQLNLTNNYIYNTKHHNKILYKYILTIFILIFLSDKLQAQNIFDAAHTKKYAEYLYNCKQYKQAAQEYKRILSYEPNNYTALDSCISMFETTNAHKQIVTLLTEQFNLLNIPDKYNTKLIKNALHSEQYRLAETYIPQLQECNKTAEQNYLAATLILQNKYRDIEKNTDNEIICSELKNLYDSVKNIKFKKPIFAAALSTILPGSGQIYSDNTEAGIQVFFMIAINSFQATQTYKTNKSIGLYTTVFGGIALGIYSGNIYGAYKEAINYNIRKQETIRKKVLKISDNIIINE